MLSKAEENYLKAIYKLTGEDSNVTTNEIAAAINTKAASVTDMLKRLTSKKLIHYKKYNGVVLTASGTEKAIAIIRKHRLWEYFLVEKLKFNWDEIHEVAEELEHINSEQLVNRLDTFLGYPRFDPHGDPIPNPDGEMIHQELTSLSEMKTAEKGKVATVLDQPLFLQRLNQLKIGVGTTIKVLEKYDYDKSMKLLLNRKHTVQVSASIADNILMTI